MKDLLINSAMSNIKKYNNYDEVKLAEIRYGLASLYLTITKTVVIFGLSYLLGYIKPLLILMGLYSLLRLFGFGVHAKKSLHCWISSTLIFIICPYLCTILTIDYKVKVILGMICVILLGIFAPADTEKRPLINKKRRMTYKVICACIGLSYIVLFFFVKDKLVNNCLLFSILIETIFVLPITYKIFGVKYNNYKTYNSKKKELKGDL